MEDTQTTPFTNRINLEELQESMAQIRAAVGSVIVGQHQMVELMLVALLAEGHVLLEGMPGVAKTLTAKLLAAAIDTGFSRIQFTPDLMPSDILGTSVYSMKTSEFDFKKGPIFSNLVLIDEINRAPAKTQAAMFEVMEERQVTMDGHTYAMADPFMVLATQNPLEQEGTYRLPEAQLDRFLFRIDVPYPDLEEEVLILQGHHERGKGFTAAAIKPVLGPAQIASARAIARQVHLSQDLLRYIARLVTTTRAYPDLYLGASPRASVAIMSSAKAYAALQGRDFVTPEDVKYLAIPVLQHRVTLTPEREMEGRTEADVLNEMIETVEVPR